VSRKLLLADGETVRTACARALICSGVDEKTGEVLTTAGLAERVGWCADLVAGMTTALVAEHWNASDVDTLASGVDPRAGSCRRMPGWRCVALAGPHRCRRG
jgi:hypothetical protein